MKINLTKLLNLHLATVVKKAMEAGELDHFNVYSWAVKRNNGFEDMQLVNEVNALVEYFER